TTASVAVTTSSWRKGGNQASSSVSFRQYSLAPAVSSFCTASAGTASVFPSFSAASAASKAASTAAPTLSDDDIDLSARHLYVERTKAGVLVARMTAGLDVELVAVPGA